MVLGLALVVGVAFICIAGGSSNAADYAQTTRTNELMQAAECTVMAHRVGACSRSGSSCVAVAVVTVGGDTVEILSGNFSDIETALASLADRFPVNTTHSCFVVEHPHPTLPDAFWEPYDTSSALRALCIFFSLLGVTIVAAVLLLLYHRRHARIAAAARLNNAEAARLEALRASCSEPPQPADAALRVAAEAPPTRAVVIDFHNGGQ